MYFIGIPVEYEKTHIHIYEALAPHKIGFEETLSSTFDAPVSTKMQV